ncbi:MAG: TRAP transporter permease [Epsilonproteobacteria bacterium]|nr:TRAP transporter permease [Campylobacterota bacterium]
MKSEENGKIEVSEEDLHKEEELIEKLEGQRIIDPKSKVGWLIAIIAFLWSLYQLAVVIIPVNSVYIRSVHLAFGIALAFLMYPLIHNKKLMYKVPWYDYIIAIVAAIGALYIAYNYGALANRSGAWLPIDIVFGVVFIILLIEASRRVLGLALGIIALVFLAYDYFGPYMPDLIAHKGASINKIIGQMYLTTEGIFGVPLGVSANYVFLFVLFGALLERAGAGAYFINLAYALLGKYDGGPAKASVAASGMMGIISGSSIANTVTTGTFTIPLMKRLGFPPHKAASVEVAASTNGQLMPPIMGAAAFIIAEFLGLSYTDVIITAAIPAFASYFALFYIVHLEAKKLGIRGEDPSKLPKAWDVFKKGIHYLIPIFFLMYTLIVLRQSPQRAAFYAIIFLLLIMVVQHPIKAILNKEKLTKEILLKGFKDIWEGMVAGAKNMVPIAIATALAGIVVGSVTLTGIGLILAEVIDQLANGNIILVLLFTAIVSLILGMGLPTTANYIVMASLTAPVIMHLAGNLNILIPTIAAHLFVFYFGILADDTPPVGMAAYAAAGIAKADPIKTGLQGFSYDIRTAILPFMFFFNTKLLLIGGITGSDINDPNNWQWITNPFEIALIFITAVIGMFAFTSATQGYFLTKANIIERLLFLAVVPFMMIPNITAKYLGYGNEYLSYAIGFAIVIALYFLHKAKIKRDGGRWSQKGIIPV